MPITDGSQNDRKQGKDVRSRHMTHAITGDHAKSIKERHWLNISQTNDDDVP